jgi:hypothetical protein
LVSRKNIKRVVAGALCAVPFLVATLVFGQTPTPLTGPGTAVVANGRVEVDGQPFFPFGFFHVTHAGTEADLLNTLNLISAAGFNTLTAGHLFTVNYGNFLDQAAQRGVRVITEFAMNSSTLTQLITNYADKPAVLGWNVADDVDDGTKTYSQVLALSTQVRTSDRRHLVSASGFRAPSEPGPGGITLATFMDITDLAQLQRYPITYAPPRAVSLAMASAVDAAKSRGPAVIANLQSFNWNGANGNGNRFPTAAEGRNMTYQAIATGVKGIIYYTFFDAATYLPTGAPALWTEFKALVPEMKTLAPVLLNGAMTKTLVDANNDRFASYWTYQNRVYVIVINTSASSAKSFALAMPAGTAGPAQPLFSGRPSGMTLANGQLSGTVQPLDVHVYVLNSASQATPQTPPNLQVN